MIPRRAAADHGVGSGAGRYKKYSSHPLSKERFVNSVAASTKGLECWFVLGWACQVIQPKKRVIKPNGTFSANICQLHRRSTRMSQTNMTNGSRMTDCLAALAIRKQ